jgi:hypothetical protein
MSLSNPTEESGSGQNIMIISSTVPDIDPKTHIIRLCGIPEADAGPDLEVWIFIDCSLFPHLLKGLESS